MPISSILKRASSYIMGSESDQIDCELKYSDNEILFCKNNVCVHPPTIARQDYDIIHHPGYLTITTKTFTDQFNNAKRPTLFLNWIPNTTLRKCPSTIENNVTDELKLRFTENKSSNEPVFHSTNPFLVQYATEQSYPSIGSDGSKFAQKLDLSMAGSTLSDHSESLSISSNSDKQSTNSNEYSTHIVIPNPRNDDSEHQIQSPINDKILPGIEPEISELQPLLADQIRKDDIVIEDKFIRSHSMTSVNITIANPCIENVDITPDNERFMRSLSLSSYDESSPNWMSTPEQLAMKHNLAFPESVTASPVISRKTPMKCRRFTVDLSQMRSLRLFFNDEQCTCGQLVVASRESQYKILHFHHGGLDHMAQVLHQWHSLLHNIRLTPGAEDSNLPYRHFMVCRPDISTSELHPEEGNIPKITADMFYGQLMNERGQIEDDLALRKGVFFGGLEKSLRKIVWPFLLHCFTYCSTYEDREFLIEIRRQEYEELTRRRLHELLPEESAHFWRTVQCVVERDVVRTDRANPFYAGEGNPNIDTLKEILLNYAVYNPGLGYTQGMSDLLAPVLCELRSASQAFWSFAGLMQRAIFVATPTDNDIDRNLNYLRELLRIMVPNFYIHLQKHADAMELLFCHRWILLCFKREFTEAVALRMWEACWSNYLTDYFHLFLCLAIIAVYADDVIAQDLRTDEMLLHFSSLAMYMDGSLILRKARGLLHEFRQLSRIPCTLAGMCRRCGPGMWDSAHHPAIECVGHGGPGGAEQCQAE